MLSRLDSLSKPALESSIVPRCDVNRTSLYYEVGGNGHSALFIHGILSGTTSHPVLRRVARVIADAMPHATLVEIEGIGHVTYAEAPDEFARIVRQWSGVSAPGA